ncbi:MAG: hypothetical protein WB784_04550 [Rhodanobacteraceae bacterium]
MRIDGFHGSVDAGEHTVERAHLRGRKIEHLLDPVYHTDPLHGSRGILAFRDYGSDILDRLRAAGFPSGRAPVLRRPYSVARPRDVIVADEA